MREDLMARALELAGSRVPFVQATVVRAQHPASARPGDAALVHPDGTIEGFVGGSCAESSVRVHALEVLASGEPVLLRVLAGAVGTSRDDGVITVANPCQSGGALEIFLEPRQRPPRVLVVGDAPVARALLELGTPLGFTMEAAGGEAAPPDRDDAAVIVASHGHSEEPALEAALRAGVGYVALVASEKRGAAVLASLDIDALQRNRVHTPAGLAIGARTAAEIALSILAELVSDRAEHRRQTAGAAGGATNALDPVCGMLVAVAEGTLQLEHHGSPVFFCGEHCRDAFAAAPARYVAPA